MITDEQILIVDDNQQTLTILETFLEDEGYQTISVDQGETALEIIEEEDIDLVILDILMPGLTGFEVCREIKFNRGYQELPVVMVTSLEAREDRLKGLEAGADDFLTKPVDWAELIGRVKSLLRLKQAYDRLESQYNRLEYQLELARSVQKVLAEEEIPDDLQGEILYHPFEQIGGDIYDIVQLGRGKYGVFVGDASGHGVPAALVMVMVKLLFAGLDNKESPARVLSQLNERIKQQFMNKLDNIFITSVYLVIDLYKREVSVANAGHPRPILIGGNDWYRIGGNHLPLGVMSGVDYADTGLSYKEDSRLFIYTDGVIELLSPGRASLADAELEETIELLQKGENGYSLLYNQIKKDIREQERTGDDICYCLLEF